MKRGFAFLFCFVWLAGAAQAGQLTEAQFTARFVQYLQSAQPGIRVTVKGPLELTVKPSSGNESHVYLNNAYLSYKNDPDGLADIIKRYASQALAMNGAAAHKLDRTRIVPIIKDRAWVEEIRQSIIAKTGKNDFALLYDDFNGDLIIVYAEDEGDHFSYPTQKHLDEAGIPRKSLRELSVANLKRMAPKYDVKRAGAVWRVKAEDGYDASMLLIDDLWTGLAKAGDIVVAVPARDVLLFAPASDAKGVAKLAELAGQVRSKSAYALTDRLFVYRNGRFGRYN